LAERLKNVGIKQGVTTLFTDNRQVIEQLSTGKIDIVLETPYSAALYYKSNAAYPILLISRKGVTEYNSLIFCRKDQPIQNLADLRGKVIAFEDPTSTSAYFFLGLHFKKMECRWFS
jgi:phosphonate transport system substrate-binding protein